MKHVRASRRGRDAHTPSSTCVRTRQRRVNNGLSTNRTSLQFLCLQQVTGRQAPLGLTDTERPFKYRQETRAVDSSSVCTRRVLLTGASRPRLARRDSPGVPPHAYAVGCVLVGPLKADTAGLMSCRPSGRTGQRRGAAGKAGKTHQ